MPAAETEAVDVSPLPEVLVVARDDVFDPACIAVPAGEVQLVVRNDGSHPHDVAVEGEAPMAAVDRDQVAFATVTVGDAGLSLVCTLHDGMRFDLRPTR